MITGFELSILVSTIYLLYPSIQFYFFHTQTAQSLFKLRNTSASVTNGKIDLHGLHVAEAQDCLYSLLPVLSGMGNKPVTIVTGSGELSVCLECL